MGAMVKLSSETDAERKEQKRLKKLAKAAAASANVSDAVLSDSFITEPSPDKTERKERKRLKKLAKAAAASEMVSKTILTDSFPTEPSSGETEAEKKERKRLKKLAKAAAASKIVSETVPNDSFPTEPSSDETATERKERKRLKKLAKAAAASEIVSETVLTDSFPTKPSFGETEAEKKERKRLKKLAKVSAFSEKVSNTVDTKPVPTDSSSASTISKKAKKKLKDKNKNIPIVDGNGDVVMVVNVVEAAGKEYHVKKSKKRKRTNENCLETQNFPDKSSDLNETPIEKDDKNKTDDVGEPVQKKIKEENTGPMKKWEPEQKGVFRKIFYMPTESTTNMPDQEVTEFRTKNKMNITGRLADIFKPVCSFDDFCLDSNIMAVCKDFKTPTPIQSQCWPIIGSGRDIIGIAETGSGKTLAFSLPALHHIMYRSENPIPGLPNNPTMLVLAPTRELAMQTQTVMEEAGKSCRILSACCYGGVRKREQKRALARGRQVVVATPGRLKDLVNMGCVSLTGVSYLVLDEADRMLDQGFEEDIRHIIKMTHPERQTCLFSATWPEAIRKLAHEFLTDPVKVTIGSGNLAANKRIKQIVEVIDERDKTDKLLKTLQKYTNTETKNRMIIFVVKKAEAYDVEVELQKKGYKTSSIHGDKDQKERTQALNSFKEGKTNLLVATDVAARGLDIPDVEFVINYSFPLTIEDYVHRIGRTGRAGKDGVAHSFFHRGDSRNAGCLVKVLKDAEQEVPKEMLKFDLRIEAKAFNKFFNKSGGDGFKGGRGMRVGGGRGGIGRGRF